MSSFANGSKGAKRFGAVVCNGQVGNQHGGLVAPTDNMLRSSTTRQRVKIYWFSGLLRLHGDHQAHT
ncbi:hypothetical protein [Mycobacterium lepromatosis]|uniref:hypothetical protein n=1 Tax=Mycobacterium lepromatosis TaxID=480418 RepID=UPI0005F78EFD|nr:hypothetical protein [Mycobacterium lepromatosis]